MTYFSDATGLAIDQPYNCSGRDTILRSLASFDPGLGGFDGVFEGSDMSMFCHSNSLGDVTERRTDDTRAVLSSALNPGSRQSQVIGNELIRKSLVMANLASKRDTVVNQSRGEIQKLRRAVRQGDNRVSQLVKRVYLANGELNPNANPLDVKALAEEYDRTKALGLRALRFQKVNALATVLRNNAMQQAGLLQQIAAAQSVGQPNVVAALSASFNTLGRESDKIRELRAAQLATSSTSKPDALEGIALGDLSFSFKKAFRSVKKSVSKAAKSVSKAATSVPGIKQVSSVVNSGLKTVAKAAGTVLNAACKLATSSVAKMGTQIGGQIVGSVYGGPTGASVGGTAGQHANDITKGGCKAVKSLGLARGKVNIGKFTKSVAAGARQYAKKNLNPRAALATATKIGSAYMANGGSEALNQYGSNAIKQLGLSGEAKQFIGQALKATGGRVTASSAAQGFLQQFGGSVGGALTARLQGNTLTNNAVAQAAGNALIQQASGSAQGSISPFLQQALGL